jgi:hypothetical protein
VVNDVTTVDSTLGESASVSSEGSPSPDSATTAENAWLAQAIRLRRKALRLAQDRIERGLVVGPSGNEDDPDDPTVRIDSEPALTADYLVENERMADLMRDLARRGLLPTVRR